jgi:hypothetical protein
VYILRFWYRWRSWHQSPRIPGRHGGHPGLGLPCCSPATRSLLSLQPRGPSSSAQGLALSFFLALQFWLFQESQRCSGLSPSSATHRWCDLVSYFTFSLAFSSIKVGGRNDPQKI